MLKLITYHQGPKPFCSSINILRRWISNSRMDAQLLTTIPDDETHTPGTTTTTTSTTSPTITRHTTDKKYNRRESERRNRDGASPRTLVQGGGRGGEKSQSPRNNNRYAAANRNLHIITDDFSKLVHESQAVRYKVHRPGCNCSKVSKLFLSNLQKPKEGFLVLPDVKTAQSIFVGGTGTFNSFPLDPLGHEQSLKDLIFPSPRNHTRSGTSIKVSCASCILDLEPNGFVCIASSNKSEIEKAKDIAQLAKETALQSGASLHPDHAHYICILRQDILRESANVSSYKSPRKSKEKPIQMNAELKNDLRSQHVCLQEDDTVEIGHHLCTMMGILKDQRIHCKYIFTIVTKSIKEKRTIYEVDLPGGKRHLGETSFDCAVRETLEETSLAIDESWLVDSGEPIKSKSRSEFGNVFYLASTPGDSRGSKEGFEDILSNMFWTNTGLGQ